MWLIIFFLSKLRTFVTSETFIRVDNGINTILPAPRVLANNLSSTKWTLTDGARYKHPYVMHILWTGSTTSKTLLLPWNQQHKLPLYVLSVHSTNNNTLACSWRCCQNKQLFINILQGIIFKRNQSSNNVRKKYISLCPRKQHLPFT